MIPRKGRDAHGHEVALNCKSEPMSALPACYVSVGDKIKTTIRNVTYTATLNTPEAAAMANDLLNAPGTDWVKVET